MTRVVRKSEGLFVALQVDGNNGNKLTETKDGKVLRLTRYEFVSTINETLDHWFVNLRHGIASSIAAQLREVSFDTPALKDDRRVALIAVELTAQRIYVDRHAPDLHEHIALHYSGFQVTVEMPLHRFEDAALERFAIDPHLPAGGYGDNFHKQLRLGWRDMLERVRKLERKSA